MDKLNSLNESIIDSNETLLKMFLYGNQSEVLLLKCALVDDAPEATIYLITFSNVVENVYKDNREPSATDWKIKTLKNAYRASYVAYANILLQRQTLTPNIKNMITDSISVFV